jgi:hypothetical protein
MPESLTYQEMLRTLGTLLDHAGSKSATIELSPEGAEVTATPWPWPRQWDPAAILAQTVVQRTLRMNPRARKIPRAGRISKRLRVVGAALDVENRAPYRLTMEVNAIVVEGRDGYRREFGPRPLASRVRLAPHLRGQMDAPTAAAAPADANAPAAPDPSIARGGLLSP